MAIIPFWAEWLLVKPATFMTFISLCFIVNFLSSEPTKAGIVWIYTTIIVISNATWIIASMQGVDSRIVAIGAFNTLLPCLVAVFANRLSKIERERRSSQAGNQ